MSEESEIAKLSSRFEAVKVAMTQDKNGHILKLAIHPNDTPEDIMRDLVGTRYMIVAVRMDDEGKPVQGEASRVGEQAVKLAATLCGDSRFQSWLAMSQIIDSPSESAAVDFVRAHCGVQSRAELKTNAAARDKLMQIRDEFAIHLRRG